MAVMPTPHHDPTEIRRLLVLRRSEKLTFKQLAARSGVPTHVLSYRASQDRRTRKAEASQVSAFVEVVAQPDPVPPSSRCSGVELLLSGGLRVQLDRDFDESTLTRLLTVVRC